MHRYVKQSEEDATMQNLEKSQYEIVHELLEDIESTTSTRDLCQSMLKTIAKVTRASGCTLMLYIEAKRTLYRCAAFGLSDWFFKKSTVSIDPGISKALKGKCVFVRDVALDFRVGYRKQVMKEGIASILNIPIKLKERVIGAMQIYGSEVRDFTDSEISLACMIANLGVDALDKAGFFEIVQRDYKAFKKSMSQLSSELDYELEAEPDVTPVEDEGPIIYAGG
jgi:signal transduction protein with GAF and PtsI domain